jgi:histidine triad (HIT) family protein
LVIGGFSEITFSEELAGMAELVDARDSKSRGGNTMSVRLRLPAPEKSARRKNEKKDKKMTEEKCLFCDIIAGKLPATVIAQNEDIIVIQDIAPKAPIHYLIIPKKHVKDIIALDDKTADLVSKMVLMAKKIAREKLNNSSFRLVFNNGPGVGQSIFHLHCHFLSGKKMTDF